MTRVDIVVIGGGMAGVSIASRLARHHDVLVLEAEDSPGMHATGRSAALFVPSLEAPVIRTLSKASVGVLFAPPQEGAVPFTRPREAMMLAEPGQEALLHKIRSSAPDAFEPLSPEEAAGRLPVLRPECLSGALMEHGCADLDVDALLQSYIRALRAGGGRILPAEPAQTLTARDSRWRVTTPRQAIDCGMIINAAGAWADHVAALAGLDPIGLQPKRRTAALFDAPLIDGVSDWPVVGDLSGSFYVKPDAGRLLISPAEETDVDPHDAFADDEALARGIDRMMHFTTLEVRRAPRAWGGLRSFARDRLPVFGFDDRAAAPFFWFAGQGGAGIQTAPANAELAEALILGAELPNFATGDLVTGVSPKRFAQ